jgi:ribA/ribD-fused uncharacterized protein
MDLPINKPALLARVRAGEHFEYHAFYGHAADAAGDLNDACFSQWWASPFDVDGVLYATAEHWMMAAKARLFEDKQARNAILAARTPAEAKRIGRGVRGFDDARWKMHREGIVARGNVAKFCQHERLRAHLMATRDAILVEASQRDVVWGVGRGLTGGQATDPRRWRGLNLLGFALTRAREILRGRRDLVNWE